VQHWKLAGPGQRLAVEVPPVQDDENVQVPPVPQPLVQHLMSSGSLGQSGCEEEVPPLLLQEVLAIQMPGVPFTVQGSLTAAKTVLKTATSAKRREFRRGMVSCLENVVCCEVERVLQLKSEPWLLMLFDSAISTSYVFFAMTRRDERVHERMTLAPAKCLAVGGHDTYDGGCSG
jgi:hypothetical protein